MTTQTWPAVTTEAGRTEALPGLFDRSVEIRATVPKPESPKPVIEKSEPGIPMVLPEATPQKFLVGTLFDDRLYLRLPIEVEMEREGDWYIAKCAQLEEFGYGYDPMEAVDDLRQTIAELYWTLKGEQDRLAPNLTRLWAHLQEVVVER